MLVWCRRSQVSFMKTDVHNKSQHDICTLPFLCPCLFLQSQIPSLPTLALTTHQCQIVYGPLKHILVTIHSLFKSTSYHLLTAVTEVPFLFTYLNALLRTHLSHLWDIPLAKHPHYFTVTYELVITPTRWQSPWGQRLHFCLLCSVSSEPRIEPDTR